MASTPFDCKLVGATIGHHVVSNGLKNGEEVQEGGMITYLTSDSPSRYIYKAVYTHDKFAGVALEYGDNRTSVSGHADNYVKIKALKSGRWLWDYAVVNSIAISDLDAGATLYLYNWHTVCGDTTGGYDLPVGIFDEISTDAMGNASTAKIWCKTTESLTT